MPYSGEIVRRARLRLDERKAEKEARYRRNLQTAYAQVPRLQDIDRQLRSGMVRAAQAAFTKGGNAEEMMAQLKEENLMLQCEYGTLVQANFEPGFLDDAPLCSLCNDNGYIGSAMCRCMAALCREEQRKEIADLTNGTERFSAFRLEYYTDRIDPRLGTSPRFIMEQNFQLCRHYAATFGAGSGNLLFVGGTGLGKTFLSACIANEVTDKGHSVSYESAPRLFSKLEKNRFSPDEESRQEVLGLMQSDLLIVDDLGTEMPGSFVTAALYSLVNDRLLAGKSTIISTNLNIEEIRVRYSPQIASRLEGSFQGLTFVGEDIRVMKSRGVTF